MKREGKEEGEGKEEEGGNEEGGRERRETGGIDKDGGKGGRGRGG